MIDSRKYSLADYANTGDVNLTELTDKFYEFTTDFNDRKHLNYRRISLTGSAPVVTILDADGTEKDMLFFASNDYLNLTRHPRTIAAGVAACQKYGSGAGSVPLLGGTLDIHKELEEKVARFKGCEAAIIFTNGFGSNCGSLAALLGQKGCAICDMLAHASLLDGCRGSNLEYFKHNDMASLEMVLKKTKDKYINRIVVVDGVYSMDGDIAHLDEIVRLAHAYGALVLVDEAHATGVIGANGRGTPEHFGIEGKVDIVAGTFSKAVGCVGGFIASTHKIINYLYYFARTYMFSTALTPQSVASILAALDVIETEPNLRADLWKNINHFQAGLSTMGLNTGNAQTAIFPIIVGDDMKVREMCRECHENGIYVNQVLYPAVQKRLARLRFSLMCNHTIEQLDFTLNFIEYLAKKYIK